MATCPRETASVAFSSRKPVTTTVAGCRLGRGWIPLALSSRGARAGPRLDGRPGPGVRLPGTPSGLLGRQRGGHEAAVTVVDLAHAHQLAPRVNVAVRPPHAA